MPIRALLFDLFGTVVHFSARAAIADVAGSRWVAAMSWLRPVADERIPAVPFDALVAALMATSEEIVRERPPEYLEVPSRERFRRALAKVGVAGVDAAAVAQELSRVHMKHLASTTFLPAGYAEILAQLKQQYQLGLVSNFDHGPTARRVLATHGIDACFDVVLVSDEVGRRKPHPSIFTQACQRLQVAREAALFIGDNPKEDIYGADAAGLMSVWVNATGEPRVTAARHVVRDLKELLTLLPGL